MPLRRTQTTATSACDESKHPGSISRSAICQGEGESPQRGRSSESKVHTPVQYRTVETFFSFLMAPLEGGRGGAPKPPGWTWGPIWGRGNDSRLRGLPSTPQEKTEPVAKSQRKEASELPIRGMPVPKEVDPRRQQRLMSCCSSPRPSSLQRLMARNPDTRDDCGPVAGRQAARATSG